MLLRSSLCKSGGVFRGMPLRSRSYISGGREEDFDLTFGFESFDFEGGNAHVTVRQRREENFSKPSS